MRVLVTGKLGKVRIPLQFDVGFGDVITPEIRHQNWSSPLDYPDVSLATYPMETVIAEKLEAAVSLGINNSRMKDFYDLHWLQAHLRFKGKDLTEAVANTFARRSTQIPDGIPVPFTEEFITDAQKNEQWSAFLRKGSLPSLELSHVMEDLSKFLLPVLNKEVSNLSWAPDRGWGSLQTDS